MTTETEPTPEQFECDVCEEIVLERCENCHRCERCCECEYDDKYAGLLPGDQGTDRP